MENITILQVSQFLIGLASLFTAGGVLVRYAIKGVEKALSPFNERIDKIQEENKRSFQGLQKQINEIQEDNKKNVQMVQLQTDKNYLVRCLADIEDDIKLDTTELEHFWYTYDDYHKNHGNSYIDHKVELLKKQGKL